MDPEERRARRRALQALARRMTIVDDAGVRGRTRAGRAEIADEAAVRRDVGTEDVREAEAKGAATMAKREYEDRLARPGEVYPGQNTYRRALRRMSRGF